MGKGVGDETLAQHLGNQARPTSITQPRTVSASRGSPESQAMGQSAKPVARPLQLMMVAVENAPRRCLRVS
jgi:hypothetical protein